jgi:radical SAM superfamily enzyme YgiQ (UPF0313 family)
VGLGLRNIDNSGYPETVRYVEDFRALVRAARAATDAPIVLGGAGYSILPREILDYTGADHGIEGEGEAAIVELVAAIQAGAARRGTVWPRRPVPVGRVRPARVPLFDLAYYHDVGGMANAQTKRGCPEECVYCSYPLIEGRCVRARDPEDVVDELEGLVRDHAVRHVFFVDNVFNAPVDHAVAVCEAIVRRGLRLAWSAYLSPREFPPDLARAMVAAGCEGIEFGTDAAADATLAALKKGFTVDAVLAASRVCAALDLAFCHSLILGGPEETPETLARTLAVMEECAPTAVLAMTGIRVYPGTGIHARALRDGVVAPDWDPLTPAFYLAPAVADRLFDLVADARARHMNWILPGTRMTGSERIFQKLRERGHRGPTWTYFRKRY